MSKRLEVICDNEIFQHSTIKLNGEEFPCHTLSIEGTVSGAWNVTAGFYVKELIIDINADVKHELDVALDIVPIDIQKSLYKKLKDIYE